MNWRIFHRAATESTNTDARAGMPGDVFTADFQTAGRGRLDHRWESTKGENLMMSAVLDVADLAPERAATLPLVVGLAVADALRFAGEMRLKWPSHRQNIPREAGRTRRPAKSACLRQMSD